MSIKGFPLPPKNNRVPSTAHDPSGPEEAKSIAPPGLLGDDAVSAILRDHLRPEHQTDENVLKFIQNYMVCRSRTQAAKEAGLPARSGHYLLTRPDIHAAIKALTLASVTKYGFDASEVVERVKEIAFVDIAEFQNEDGSYKTSLAGLSPETRRAVKKFKVKNIYENDPNGMQVKVGELIEVEMWDKMKSLELLGREEDLFKETKKVQHDVTNNMAAVLLDSSKRADERIARLTEPDRALEITARDVTTDGSNGKES